MSEQQDLAITLERPTTDDRDEWKTYWKAQGMLWRTEPEIGEERQRYLSERRAIQPDMEEGIYPFKDIRQKLTRADIEWLLSTHESRGIIGPVVCEGGMEPLRDGLDLRGADLTGMDLSYLPLAGICGGLGLNSAGIDGGQNDPKRIAAAACFDGSNLAFAHLEYATMIGASLRGAVFACSHLERIIAHWADLERASLATAYAEGAILMFAKLEGIFAMQVHLEGAALYGANLNNASLAGAHLEGVGMADAQLAKASCRQAHLEGANLAKVHLEGTDFGAASLCGKHMSIEDLVRIRTWVPNFKEIQLPTDLREVFFDSTTNMFATKLSDPEFGAVALADTHYDGLNLEVVDWKSVWKLRDEQEADEQKKELPKLVSPDLWRFAQYRAVRAYRQLAIALRERGMNGDADRFAYRAQVVERPILRYDKKWGAWLISWGLALLAGYGYRLRHILIAYIAMLFLFTMAYWFMGVHSHHDESGLQALWDSFLVSLSAIHGRTMFEQLGAWSSAAWVAAIESVVGIVIEGIFVAMLIQRFFAR